MHIELLKPVVALVAWTLLMLTWGVVLRLASSKEVDNALGKRMVEAGSVLPTKSQFKIDNYNHLLEQPILFYVVVIALCFLHGESDINIYIAWTYVSLRIIHSIVQATSNPVMVRFLVFMAASIPLFWLTANTALLIF